MTPRAVSFSTTFIENQPSSNEVQTTDNKSALDVNAKTMTQASTNSVLLKKIKPENTILNIHDNICSAIRTGNFNKLKKWIKNLKDINQSLDLFTKRTALHLAALHGHKRMVGLLKGKGADLKVLDIDGKTPFELAKAAYFENGSLQKKLNRPAQPISIG